MQVVSVHMLPIPQFGQRFSPSVETANGLSPSTSFFRRCRPMMMIVASSPTTAARTSARLVFWSMFGVLTATEADPPIRLVARPSVAPRPVEFQERSGWDVAFRP